jgi:uncharacterized membrane protein YkvA (DUF1232 family)
MGAGFARLRELVLLLPRLARMLAALMGDPAVPKAAKVVLVALAVYLASPIDLIPDVIPLVGYLDDVLLVAIILDGILSHVDRAILLKYWPSGGPSIDAMAAIAARIARFVPARIKARIFGSR